MKICLNRPHQCFKLTDSPLADDGKPGTPEDIERFMQEHGLHFPVIADPDGHLATRWGVRGVPATLIVDANKPIRQSTVGASTERSLRVRLWISGLGDD